MRCKEVRKELSALLDGEFSLSASEVIRRHVDSCGSCSLFYEELKQVKHLVDRESVEEAIDVSDRVMASILSEMPEKKKPVQKNGIARIVNSAWFRAAALILFVSLVSLPFLLTSSDKESASAVEDLVEETESFFSDFSRTFSDAGKGMSAAPENIAFDMKKVWFSFAGKGSVDRLSDIMQNSRSVFSGNSKSMSGFFKGFISSFPIRKRTQ